MATQRTPLHHTENTTKKKVLSLVLTVQGAGPEEGPLHPGLVQGVHQRGRELVGPVVVGERQHAGLRALAYHGAGGVRALEHLDWVRDGKGGGAEREGEGCDGGFEEHLACLID